MMTGGQDMSKTYTTISGDMWDKIAAEQMGSTMIPGGDGDGFVIGGLL